MKSFNLSKKSFAKIKQRGQGMSEYIIIVALIAVGAIGVFTAFGGVIRQQVAGMAMELSGKDGSDNVTQSKNNAAYGVTSAGRVTNMGSYAGQTANTNQK